MRQGLERLFPSLRRKIAFAVVLGMLIAGSTFIYFAQRTGYTMLEQQTQLKAKSIADILTNLAEHEMLERSSDHIKKTMLSALSSPDIVNVYLLKRDGTISVQANDQDTLEQFSLGQFQNVQEHGGEKYLARRENERLYEYIIIPVMKKQECNACHQDQNLLRGYFGVKLAVDDVRSLTSRHRTTNILMTVVTFLGLGVIMYFALSLLIIRPLSALHTHIKKVEAGIKQLEVGERTIFPLLPEPVSYDEIADFTRDVNKLVNRLNEANATLIEMHQLQLEQAARLASVGEMAASMAHEIKNPISGVLGAVQVFEGELMKEDPKKEIFSEMRVQLERVNHAVTDLLTFARPTPPVFEHVGINGIIRRTATMLAKQINEEHVEVTMNLSEGANTLSADKKQIQQVVWNVMLNAVQAMDTPGKLYIASEKQHDVIVLTFSDTGKGIPDECLSEVFKPFFTTKHKGTGLGMTIVRRIVEQHGGTIKLRSKVGQGTIVSIELPQQQGSA